MHPRTDGRETLVARVDPDRCVSCGICAGSCAPMGIGPPLRTGRDQLAALRQAVELPPLAGRRRVLAICCENAAPDQLEAIETEGAELRRVTCAGNLHSSVIEVALRQGAPGVIVFTCPPRDCRGREGVKWLNERLYNDREAELQPRVPRERVAVAVMAAGDLAATRRALHDFIARTGRVAASSLDSAGLGAGDDDPLCSTEALAGSEGDA